MSEEKIPNLGILRAINSDEIELMLAWRNSPNIRANMYTRHEISLDEHLAWWKRIQQRADQQYFMYEFMGTPVGIVAFTGIDTANRNSFWAFYASPAAPTGTGSKMEFLALEHAFGKLNLHKLCCEVLDFNDPVISLHKKFGFKVEGIFRDQHLLDEGYADIYRLGMLASEWQECRNSMLSKITRILRLEK